MADMSLTVAELENMKQKIIITRNKAMDSMLKLANKVDVVPQEEWAGKNRSSFQDAFSLVYWRLHETLSGDNSDKSAFSALEHYLDLMIEHAKTLDQM